MRIQKASSAVLDGPRLTVYQLPSQIVDRAANGLGWVSLICGVTSVALTAIQYVFQPEFAVAWSHPALRLVTLLVVLISAAFMVVQQSGWLTKHQLLDLGIVFQGAIAFAGGVFEGAAYRDPNAMVVGVSGVGIWMMLCARLMPKAPL